MKFQLQQLEQMLDNAMNHASILTWGWFNEGPSSEPKACPAYAANAKYARARDPTRFTTWADDTDTRGACYEHATLISFNDYPGWYNHAGDINAPQIWNQRRRCVRLLGLAGARALQRGARRLGLPLVPRQLSARLAQRRRRRRPLRGLRRVGAIPLERRLLVRVHLLRDDHELLAQRRRRGLRRRALRLLPRRRHRRGAAAAHGPQRRQRLAQIEPQARLRPPVRRRVVAQRGVLGLRLLELLEHARHLAPHAVDLRAHGGRARGRAVRLRWQSLCDHRRYLGLRLRLLHDVAGRRATPLVDASHPGPPVR